MKIKGKCYEEKHVDILLIGEEGKSHYVFMKDFDLFMYDHTLYSERKKNCCLVFNTKEILKSHIRDCFKINGKTHFINIMIEEGKYGSDGIRIHFNKELMMTKEDN